MWSDDLMTMEPTGVTLVGHKRFPEAIAWNPLNTQLASAAFGGSIRIWNYLTGHCLHTFTSGDHDFMHWESTHPLLLVGAKLTGVIQVFNTILGVLVTTIRTVLRMNDLQWTQNGTQCISCHPLNGGCDSMVSVWDIQSGQLVWERHFSSNTRIVSNLRCSPAYATILHSGYNELQVIQANTTAPVRCIPSLKLYGGAYKFACVAVHPTGRYWALMSELCVILIWDVYQWKCVKSFECMPHVKQMVWIHGGAQLLVINDDNEMEMHK